MSLINIIVLSFKLLVDFWDVFVYGRGWPHASQVCCDSNFYLRCLRSSDTQVISPSFQVNVASTNALPETQSGNLRLLQLTQVINLKITTT